MSRYLFNRAHERHTLTVLCIGLQRFVCSLVGVLDSLADSKQTSALAFLLTDGAFDKVHI